MLYPKNQSPELSRELFKAPTSEYRGAPFWSWNCRLDKDELMRQADILGQMGFGGYHMHVRSGMDTPYLGDEFMSCIRACVDKAEKNGMLAWLYDEDRWPSGFAGGLVTKDEKYRIRYLLFTPFSYEEVAGKIRSGNEQATALRSGNGKLICRFSVTLDDDGCLASYRVLGDKEEADEGGRVFYAYLESPHTSPRYNGYTYVNTMDKAAIERFIEITHEAYFREVGDRFGNTVPAIFTDEPQFTHKQTLKFASSLEDVALPWTDDFDDTYRAAYGESILARLPELIWELPESVSDARYHYHDHACERFATAFADTIGNWCDAHGLALTGHMMKEPTLGTQTSAVGEAMRSLRAFALPGIDMLANRRELNTAKQAASVAHQYGREGVMSELYGVTDWDYDFRGHKLQGDWQAALGVTVRVPHLSWVSMEGESKRDYPASINYQSPWYAKYPLVEDHFARLNTALTRGTPEIRTAVIHPVESYWLHWGPAEQTALARDTLDSNFQNVTNWLLYGSVDFDFISESLLPSLCGQGGAPLKVGKMEYDVIIVPGCETLRSTTCERLEAFRKAGGRLIFMGSAPKYLDAHPSDIPGELYESSEHIGFTRGELLSALAADRTVELRQMNGELTNNLFHQLRRDGNGMWLFIAQADEPYNKDISRRQRIKITVKGIWKATLYDTMTGEVKPFEFRHERGRTVIPAGLWLHDSLLLRLDPCQECESYKPAPAPATTETPIRIPYSVPFSLSEPNALLLDKAEFALDGGEFEPREELLRVDTLLRRRLGWDPWGGSANQPWCIPAEPTEHTVRLRFRIESRIPLVGTHLALEAAKNTKITLNGATVPSDTDGYYVDKAISTVPMPDISAGVSVLELEAPFGKRTAIEWCYLLGDFGVSVHGACTVVEELPKLLAFETITTQGLPFYSGAVSYRFDIATNGGALSLRLPQYRAAVYECTLDGERTVTGAFSPYSVVWHDVPAGKHTVEVKLYISRTNGFGHLHCADRMLSYPSPGAWRTSGDAWCQEYRLHEEGLIASPLFSELFPR